MNSWLDQSFRRWAYWYEHIRLGKGRGFPPSSPIANFGMPPSTGNVWDMPEVEDWSDCIELHESLKVWVKTEKIAFGEWHLLLTYYVDTRCSYRKTGRAIGATDKTIKSWLEIVLLKVDRLMVESKQKGEPVRELSAMGVIE